jgi:hypothetical protein
MHYNLWFDWLLRETDVRRLIDRQDSWTDEQMNRLKGNSWADKKTERLRVQMERQRDRDTHGNMQIWQLQRVNADRHDMIKWVNRQMNRQTHEHFGSQKTDRQTKRWVGQQMDWSISRQTDVQMIDRQMKKGTKSQMEKRASKNKKNKLALQMDRQTYR